MKRKKARAFIGKRSRTVVVLLPETIDEAVKAFGKNQVLEMIHQMRTIEVQRQVRQQMADASMKRVKRYLKKLTPKQLRALKKLK